MSVELVCTRAATPSMALGELLGGTVVGLSSRPYPHATSARIDAVTVTCLDGARHELILKDLGGPGARRTSAADVLDGAREPWAHAVLRDVGLATPALGRWRPSGREADWLVLRHVEGMQLRFTDAPTAWANAGGWLAEVQRRTSGCLDDGPSLIRRDSRWHRSWLARARRFHPNEEHVLDQIEEVLDRWEPDGDVLVHGDLYPANLIVAGASVTAVVDWEMAGRGDRWLDLACLVAGDLPDALRDAAVGGYTEVTGDDAPRAEAALARAQLLVCLQWLGWASPTEWRPPRAQRRRWADDARRSLRAVRRAEVCP